MPALYGRQDACRYRQKRGGGFHLRLSVLDFDYKYPPYGLLTLKNISGLSMMFV